MKNLSCLTRLRLWLINHSRGHEKPVGEINATLSTWLKTTYMRFGLRAVT